MLCYFFISANNVSFCCGGLSAHIGLCELLNSFSKEHQEVPALAKP